MKASLIASSLALAGAVVASPNTLEKRQSSGTEPVSVKGNMFVKKDGSRFYIRGVDYQPGGDADSKDPIAKLEHCKRDIAEFVKLGINTVRIYSVDNSVNHDECMKELADNGIYLALDVNTNKYSITRDNPHRSYNVAYLQHIFATMDAFAKYDNTLLFFAGNEVINNEKNTNTAPYVKAVQRDMKQYLKAQGHRSIPVGYSAADVASNQFESAEYFNCGGDEQRGDFFSFNNYEWCAPSSYTKSGWDQKVSQYKDYTIPLFLSEFGCAENPPRPFDEIASLYNEKMTPVFSGGLVYQYTEEAEKPHTGLVKLGGNTVSELGDFRSLKKQYAANPAPTGDGGAKTSNGAASRCPAQSSKWNTKPYTGSDLPAIPEPALDFMKNGAGEGKGLSGSSQTSGGATSSGSQTAGSGPAAKQSGSPSSGAATPMPIPALSVAPFLCGIVVVLSSVFGAGLL